MKLEIYQIDNNHDNEGVCFLSYDSLMKMLKNNPIDSSIYSLVYSGDVDCSSLEEVYEMFNIDQPADYTGRSMSVSDVVYLPAEGKYYYCDSIGFKEIRFDVSQVRDKYLTVVYLEPDKLAQVKVISNDLESMQQLVGGYIETYYGIDDPCVIICNDEGKLNGMPLNRAIRQNGQIVEVIAGPFFICDASGPNLRSLSKELIDKYIKQFRFPELFFRANNGICAIAYKPDENKI